MKRLRSYVAGILMALCSGPAISALMSADLFEAGDRLLTLDSDTSLEWLDLTETQFLTVNDVLANRGGWRSLGFRHATMFEVQNLYQSVAITSDIGFTASNHPGTLLLLDLMGCTAACDGDQPRGQGLAGLEEPGPGLARAPSVLATLSVGESFSSLYLSSNVVDFDFNNGNLGNYLVRASAVPLPATASLVASALFFVAFASKHGHNSN
jgi:hypothetical protein